MGELGSVPKGKSGILRRNVETSVMLSSEIRT
jgi:hypothetical protein